MAVGCYIITYSEDRRDLIVELVSLDEGSPPSEQQNLLWDITNTISDLQQIYLADSVGFGKMFDQLFYLAKIGLEGPNAQPEMAALILKQLKLGVINREAGKIKNNYLRLLGKFSALLGIVPVFAGSLLLLIPPEVKFAQYIDVPKTANMLILWAGTMLGVWLSFAITKVTLDFEDLNMLEKDRLEPLLRLLFTGGLAIVFGLMFIKSAIVIEIGELSSRKVGEDHITAFLLGTVLGMNERILGKVLWKKAGQING